MRRRAFLLTPLALLAARARAAEAYPAVAPGHAMEFPRDHGAHPAFRTEWWYVTGWLAGEGRRALGFQITFFRNRPRIARGESERFAPRQLAVRARGARGSARRPAACTTSAPRARASASPRHARTLPTCGCDDWSLRATPDGYAARIPARDFALDLALRATQPILLQGERGFSRKGPRPAPGELLLQPAAARGRGHGRAGPHARNACRDAPGSITSGRARRWRAEAVGWDWVGLNLADGGALMAFRMRSTGRRHVLGRRRAARCRRAGCGLSRRRRSASSRCGAGVAAHRRSSIRWRCACGPATSSLRSRAADGRPGARFAREHRHDLLGGRGAGEDGRAAPSGRGYLELTGYWKPLKL